MANTYKNIVITPNTGSSTGDPTVVFSGGNTSVNTDITLRVYPDSNGTLSFEGAAGQLFSITNDLTNTIFSVNDVSGIPLIEVNVTSQQITFGEFYGNVGVGRSASTSSTYKLDVAGTINAANILVNGSPLTTSLTPANNYAGVMANSANGYASTIVDANLVTARAYTNTSTTAANNYAGAMANSANAYAITIGASSNAWANSLGVNTSLAYTWSNTQTFQSTVSFSSNVFYRNTSNIVWITNAASSVSNVTLKNYPDSNGTLSFEGSAGQLFSITNDLTGSLFSVNDVSGIPLIEVNVTSQQITFGEFYGNVGIGRSASTGSTYKLDVNGTINASNILVNGSPLTTSLTPANNYAGVMANSANGYAETIVASNLVTARAYTNTSTTAANNYAGVMANSSNAFASATFGTITNTTAAFAAANQAGVVANNANTFAGTTYVKKVGDTISGDLVVQGNLTTSGVVTYANTQTLLIGDSLITLNNDIPVAVAPSEDAGIEVKRGSSANVSLLWREGNDNWTLTNDGTTWYSIATNNDVTSANNYAGAMANSANGFASTIVDANLIVARAYTNTSTTAANNYSGVMANSANAYASTIVDANLVTARAYTNTSTTSANNYAGAMANSANAYASSLTPNLTPAFSAANQAGVIANAAFDKANTGGGGASTVNVSTTGPTNNTNGTLWFNSNLGRLFIYYTDVDSSQWIEASPASGSVDTELLLSYTNAASDLAVLAYTVANAGYVVANAGYTTANLGYTVSNAAFAVANAAFNAANAEYSITNTAFDVANAAFNAANTANSRLANTNVVLAGNLTTTGAVIDSKGDTRDIPPTDRTSSMPYGLTISDTGKMVLANGNTAATANVFVPNTVFFIGNTIMITNQSTSNVTITQNSGVTMFLAGNAAAVGNRTLAGKGIATIICVGANNFIISGAGLT
jgi:hypothetical protein